MATFVDDMEMRADVPNGNRVVRGKWSHMIADTRDELMAMADRIGLRPEWIQYPGTPDEHFDLTLSKKRAAIAAGAIPITWLELGREVLERKRVANRPAEPEPSRGTDDR